MPWKEDHRKQGVVSFKLRMFEDKIELQEKAKARGITVSELIRLYIEWGLETDDNK